MNGISNNYANLASASRGGGGYNVQRIQPQQGFSSADWAGIAASSSAAAASRHNARASALEGIYGQGIAAQSAATNQGMAQLGNTYATGLQTVSRQREATKAIKQEREARNSPINWVKTISGAALTAAGAATGGGMGAMGGMGGLAGAFGGGNSFGGLSSLSSDNITSMFSGGYNLGGYR